MASLPDLRPSPYAGTWYEGSPERLARQVDAYLDGASLPDLPGEVVALIAPHAGHIYSGRTAGHAFRAVRGKSFDRVVVVSPLHRGYHPSPVLTSAHKAYATPLGPVWLDQDALAAFGQALKKLAGQEPAAVVRDQEHSLEIELPFLQRTLAGEFKLLPLMLRSREESLLKAVGLALSEMIQADPKHKTLLVASTDLSHFYTQREAEVLDGEMLRRFEAFSPEGALEAEQEELGFACGVGPVAAVLWAAKALGANSVKVVHYSTSADETGDRNSVVGYGAAVVLKT